MELYLIMALLAVSLLTLIAALKGSGKSSDKKLEELKTELSALRSEVVRIEGAVKDEIARNREETGKALKENREEIGNSFRNLGETTRATLSEMGLQQKQQLTDLMTKQGELTAATENKLEKVRETVEGKLKTLQEENTKKLEEMRVTVDEKLQASVEKRFNDSFKLISERLDQVHKGLGEMQTLAHGVGDLKKVLSNVKTRGTLGEIQLGSILEQILSSEQYEQNAVTTPGSLERVEFAVRLPGRDSGDRPVLLPIDSKFPIEDYQRLQEASENAPDYSPAELEAMGKQFESAVKKSARDIRDKYINPPDTTDFAILFVPTEGLYAEILRRAGLFETLQRDYRITVVGPSNLVAFLSSLQMGFRTLAIEKRSSEVWEVLGAVKTEFGNFGQILDKTRKKLQEAANVIDKAGVRSRAIERRLRDVQELPGEESARLLGDAFIQEEDEERLNQED